MNLKNYLPILRCPDCLGDLSITADSNLICLRCRRHFDVVNGNIPILLPKELEREQILAIDTWGREYRDLLRKKNFVYRDKYCKGDVDLIAKAVNFQKDNGIFLELGCGRARVCLAMLHKGFRNVIGMDISIDAVKLASELCRHNSLSNFFFVVGDIYNPPIREKSIDLIFAGGSIEHFRDAYGGLKKVHEIMKISGEFIATVPYTSMSTLLQGFLTGNIPRLPVLASFYEFFHTYIMRNKNLMYGFEYSFSARELSKMLSNIGFANCRHGYYDVEYDLKFVPQPLKNFFQKLIRFRLFWPMIYISAIRSR